MAEEKKYVRALAGFPVPYEENPRGAVVAGEEFSVDASRVDALVEDRLVEDISDEEQFSQEDTAPLVGRHIDYFKEQNPEEYKDIAVVYSEGHAGIDSVAKAKQSVAQAQAELDAKRAEEEDSSSDSADSAAGSDAGGPSTASSRNE